MQAYLRAIAAGWWIVLITLIVGLSLASAYNSISKPVYSSSVKFFVSTQTGADQSPLQADEFAQRRINSYVQLMTSEAMIKQVISTAHLDLSVRQLTSMVSAYSDPETVLLGVEVHDTDKERAFQIAKAVANDFEGLVAKLDNRGTTEIANVKLNVVSGPTLTEEPISPRTTLNLALGGIVGLGLGLAIAILRRTSKRSVGSAAEVRELLGVSTLGTIARVRGDAATDQALARSAERLATILGLGTPASKYRVIEVASPQPGDGRSLVATALARAVASLGHRVVLVEADLRNPHLASEFCVSGESGLVEILTGSAQITDAISSTVIPNLDIIVAGSVTGHHPPELFARDAFAQLIDELQGRFDVVIVDTAALIPYVDGAVIARSVDGIVLVVNRDRSTKDDLSRAVDSLASHSSKLLGAAMNTAPARTKQRNTPETARAPEPAPSTTDTAAVRS